MNASLKTSFGIQRIEDTELNDTSWRSL